MEKLAELIADAGRRHAIVDDAVKVLEAEVDGKKGLSGMAIKAGYKVVAGLKPGFVRGAIDDMIEEFVSALDPMYQEAKATGKSTSAVILSKPDAAADALLGITDRRAAGSTNGTLTKLYGKLRPMAKAQVVEAVPAIAGLLDRHIPKS